MNKKFQKNKRRSTLEDAVSASGGLVRNSAQPIRWARGLLKFPISSHHSCRAATRMTLTRHGVRGLSIFGGFCGEMRRRGAASVLDRCGMCVCAASPRQYISIVPTTTGLAATHDAGQCAAVSRGRPAALQTPSIRGLPGLPGLPSQVKRLPEWQDHGLCCAGGRNEPFPCSGKMSLGSCGNTEQRVKNSRELLSGRRPASAEDSSECRFLHVSPTCRRLQRHGASCRNAHARARERRCDWVGKQPGYGNAPAHFKSVPTTRHPPHWRTLAHSLHRLGSITRAAGSSRDVSLRR